MRSARAVRDFGAWDPAADAVLPIIDLDAPPPSRSNSETGNLLLATFACTLLFTAVMLRDGNAAAGGRDTQGPLTRFAASLGSFVPSPRHVELREDFRSGLTDWGGGAGSGNWSTYAGYIRPGNLRIWQRSAAMTDYQFEFVGEIQQKGLGWAYRARDPKNYYASEIVLGRSGGPLPGADLVRYAILDGHEYRKVRLPLPTLIKREVPYKIRMDVRGTQFTTSVNGHVVDTWSDDALRMGGVGLFASKGNLATIRSASVEEYSTWMTAIFSAALLPLPRL